MSKATIKWPEVPDFRDYGHGYPAKATEIKIGLLYYCHFDLVRPKARHGSAFEVDRFNLATGEWEAFKQLIGARTLVPYDEGHLDQMQRNRNQILLNEKREAKYRREAEAKRRKEQSEIDFFQIHGFKLAYVMETKGEIKPGKTQSRVTISMPKADYNKLKAILAASS